MSTVKSKKHTAKNKNSSSKKNVNVAKSEKNSHSAVRENKGTLRNGKVSLLVPLLLFFAVGTFIVILSYYSTPDEYRLLDFDFANITIAVTELSSLQQESLIQNCFDENPNVQQRDWCYMNLAREYRIDACDDIIQTDHSRFCKSIIDARPSKCLEISSTSLRESCFIVMAQLLKEPSICEFTDRQEYCLSTI